MTNPKEVLEWLEQQKNRPPRTIFDEIISSKKRLAEFIYMVCYACSTCDKTNGGKVSPYCQFCKQCLDNNEDALCWLNWPAKKLTLDNPVVEEDNEEMEGKETNNDWFNSLSINEKAKVLSTVSLQAWGDGMNEELPSEKIFTDYWIRWLNKEHKDDMQEM